MSSCCSLLCLPLVMLVINHCLTKDQSSVSNMTLKSIKTRNKHESGDAKLIDRHNHQTENDDSSGSMSVERVERVRGKINKPFLHGLKNLISYNLETLSESQDRHIRVKRYSQEWYTSPFDNITFNFDDFKRKIVAIDSIFCGNLCVMMFPGAAEFSNGLCATCSCDEHCQWYGDCCVDLVLLHNRTKTTTVPLGCESDSVRPNIAESLYLMVNGCPQSALQVVKEQCNIRSRGDWLSNVPATSNSTGLTLVYRNLHCAACHDASGVTLWQTQVICEPNSSIWEKDAITKDLYAKAVFDRSCQVNFLPEQTDGLHPCSEVYATYIDECNVTGLWRTYDDKIEKACQSYTNVVHNTYKNVFCYMCNTDIPWMIVLQERLPADSEGEPEGLNLIVLLQVPPPSRDSDQLKNQTRCSTEEVFDPYKKICIRVRCPIGKNLMNDSCSSEYKTTNIFGYRLCLLVTIYQPRPLSVESIEQMAMDISLSARKQIPSDARRLNTSLEILDLKNCLGSHLRIVWKLTILMNTPNLVDRDEFEKALLNIKRNTITAIVQLYNRSDIVDSPSCNYEFLKPSLLCLEPTGNTEFIFFNSTDPSSIKHLFTLDVNALLICPYVQLPDRDVILPSRNVSTPNPTFSLYIKAAKMEVESGNYVLLDNRSVLVCARIYTGPDILYGSRVSTLSAISIASIVCTYLSLVFLVLSLCMYCIFPQLRTSSGVSNMGLIVTLFIAQVLFQFGVEGTEVHALCNVIGMLVHLFWLASVWWMNAIVIYLFYTLCFPLRSMYVARAVRKVFLASLVYAYSCSALVVLSTIAANMAMFGDTGYGANLCYLNRDASVTFAFCVPIGILVFTNILLFVITIWKLRNHGSISSSKEHKVSMVACVKLSTTTGVSWVFAFLYLTVKVDIFSAIFSILVSSQGVLLFIAFFTNRRVWGLVQEKFRKKKQTSSASGSADMINTTSTHF